MAFCAPEDIAARRGKQSLTAVETALAELLCDAASSVIAAEVGRDDEWAAALSPVPDVVRFVAVEMVNRAFANPDSAQAVRERLGQYEHSSSFGSGAADGLMMTPTEALLVRRAVCGRTTVGVATESSQVEEHHDLLYGS